MIVIACVDNNLGLCFNKRRQSRDRCVYDRIYEIIGDKKLSINDFSKELFDSSKITLKKEPFTYDLNNEFCFIENIVPNNLYMAEKIILYFWNRDYPSDLKFKLPDGFTAISTFEFKGNSHEKITEITYEKNI